MTSETRVRLRPRVRKAVLLAHIAASGAWLGMDLVLGVLVVTTLTGAGGPGGPGGTATAAAISVASVAPWPLAVVGAVTLVTGVVLGLGSRYGLTRYWWVLVKLVLNVVLLILVLALLGPGVGEASATAQEAAAAGGRIAGDPQMLFPPVVSSTAVIVAMALSVFKPWGRLRPRPQASDQVDGAARADGLARDQVGASSASGSTGR